MLKHYCPECGNPTSYTLNKPKFCSSCGKSFDKNINAISKAKINEYEYENKKINFSNKTEAFDEEDDTNYFDNNIKGLDFDIATNKLNKNKIKDIIGTSKKGEERKEPRKKMSKLEKKKILEEFSNEAKSIRPKNKLEK